MSTIRKQSIANTIISYVGVCIGFLNLIVLQPYMLKPEEFGLTRIMYSFTLLIGTLFPAGLNLLTIKFFPHFRNKENGHNGYLGALMLLALSGFIIVAIIILLCKGYILSKYSNSPLFIDYFYYVFPISFCIGFTSVLTGFCSVLFKTSVPSFLNDVFLRLSITVIVSLYYLKLISLAVFIFLYAASYLIQLLALISYLRYLKAFYLKINWSFLRSQPLREMFRYTFLLAFAVFAAIGMRNIDVLIVGSYLNLDAVAVYSLGMTIGNLIEIPINSLGRISDSKISDAIQRNDMKMVKEVYYKSVRYMLLIGGVLFVLLFSNINEAITFLPKKYAEAKWVIIIISFSALTNMATGVNTAIIYFSHKYVTGAYLLFAMILISIGFNMILIPVFGIEGSATATAIAMILYNIAKFFLIRKHFGFQPYDARTFKILICIAACLAVSFLLPVFDVRIPMIIGRSIVLLIAFVALLLGLKVFTLSEIKNIKSLL
jgi:O-antigen/teichoic acid export membrane protein